MEKSDVKDIWSNMKHREKVLWQSKKFLLGLSHTHILDDNSHDNEEYLPESLLRKDDIFYEDLRKEVEKRFGVLNADAEQDTLHGDIQFHGIRHMSKVILHLLDSLSNVGLYRLAKIVTEGSLVTFQNTRPQMRKVIKVSLEVLQSMPCQGDQLKILSQVTELVTNQNNFHRNHVRHLDVTLKSHRGAIMKVLDGLGSMPTQTLNAIYRKLKGTSGYMPQLNPPRSGWNRDRLIDRVRTLCLEMIGQLGEYDKLQEPLAKAMAVAGLSFKLASGYQDMCLTKFVHVSPATEALHNDIFKAIQSLAVRTEKMDIKEVQQVLDPETVMTGKGVKAAVKNMLIEYLFECSDMYRIPNSLFEALTLINEKSVNRRRFFPKDLIEEEVESILNLSASIKQILLDRLPGENIDQDFADAYMEELEESDDGDIFDDDDEELELDTVRKFLNTFNDFNEEVQSNGDLDEAGSSSSQGYPPVSLEFGDDMETQGPAEYKNENKKAEENQKKCRNQYLTLQKVSDEASFITYRLIGHMMEGFARNVGISLSCDDVTYLTGELSRPEYVQDSGVASKGKCVSDADRAQVLTEAIRKVLPSFSRRDLKKLEKFMKS